MKLQKSKEVSEARGRYNIAVMFYISLFEQKYDLEFSCWAGGRVGGLALFTDFTNEPPIAFSFDRIKRDIDYFPKQISLDDE